MSPSIGTTDTDMFLFTMKYSNSPDNRRFSGKIWYFKIYENNKIIKNFVPCYDRFDGTIGLYETVEHKFYYNEGSGNFSTNEEIVYKLDYDGLLPSTYQEVEYIKNNGNNAIDTLYKPNSKTRIIVKATSNGIANKTALFGCRYQWTKSFLSFIENTYSGSTNVIRIDINKDSTSRFDWCTF